MPFYDFHVNQYQSLVLFHSFVSIPIFFFFCYATDPLASRYRIQGSRKRRVTIIIGVGERHWLNWCWSVERFAGGRHVFGATVQLSAATRDFPLHVHLHASQTPKGCSFTQATIGWVVWMGGRRYCWLPG